MKENSKGLTEIIFVIDRSGSMSGLEAVTIGTYNAFIEKEADGKTLITTVLFDDQYELLYNGVKPKKAHLDNKKYFVRGSTALLDAVGKTILDVGNRLSHVGESEHPDKIIMVITTDGFENASREFTKEKVKELISHQQKKHNWSFLFFGANIDSVSTAQGIGISADCAKNYQATPCGTQAMMEEMEACVCAMRE